MSTPAGIRLREEQDPPELWLMIWKDVALKNEGHYNLPHSRLFDNGPPFFVRADPQLRADPRRRRAKLAFAACYATALKVYGPELYEHVVWIDRRAVESLLDCAMQAALHPIEPICRALWVRHIDLILSDNVSRQFDWVSTQQAWSGFRHLQTLTICYYPKEPAPLIPYRPIAAHLPQSLQLLRLRPWGEADDIPPQFPQFLKGGAEGRIRGPRRDFWWGNSWAAQVHAFQNVPNIHLQAVVYVVWPPYSLQAAEEVFRPWTAQVNGGRLHNISVTLFPPHEGLAIEEAVQELGGGVLDEGKKYGYFPQDAEDLDHPPPEFFSYDWRIGANGQWEVDMSGEIAHGWAKDYGRFSYQVAGRLDQRLDWGW